MTKQKKENINELIEKYFEGLTSLQEEQSLRDYFQQENIPEEWRVYQPVFQFFSQEIVTEKNLSEKPLSVVKPRRRNFFYTSIAAAASIILLFGLKLALDVELRTPEKSQAYINGKKMTNMVLIRTEILKTLENIAEENEDVFSSQIDALDFFLDNN
ncbi:hypothetical protein FACS1894123_05850 [Bacteroidia bacterium]|nr:hypothetical protein FACS1894123_05850 [Bacteroidia bacterium]